MAAPAPAATGMVRVERVGGRSAVTTCFAKYPLKLIAPSKVGPTSSGAGWLYAITYGGGIVSGDVISFAVDVGDGCTAAMTTQASTKVYKAVDSKCSEHVLEARVGKDTLFALIPDPSGEKWNFSFYKSINHILLEDQPLFIDSEYNVVAMVILLGPKLKHIQEQMQDEVKKMMSVQLRPPTSVGGRYSTRLQPLHPQRPPLIASCSPFGRIGTGMIARITAVSTESVYLFLRRHLAALGSFLGTCPYSAS